jgi:hypothetical protein
VGLVIVAMNLLVIQNTGKSSDLEGTGRCLIEVLFLHMLERTEERHKKSQSGYPVSRLGFEPNTSIVPRDHSPIRLDLSKL